MPPNPGEMCVVWRTGPELRAARSGTWWVEMIPRQAAARHKFDGGGIARKAGDKIEVYNRYLAAGAHTAPPFRRCFRVFHRADKQFCRRRRSPSGRCSGSRTAGIIRLCWRRDSSVSTTSPVIDELRPTSPSRAQKRRYLQSAGLLFDVSIIPRPPETATVAFLSNTDWKGSSASEALWEPCG